jgi:hypothetical protein
MAEAKSKIIQERLTEWVSITGERRFTILTAVHIGGAKF